MWIPYRQIDPVTSAMTKMVFNAAPALNPEGVPFCRLAFSDALSWTPELSCIPRDPLTLQRLVVLISSSLMRHAEHHSCITSNQTLASWLAVVPYIPAYFYHLHLTTTNVKTTQKQGQGKQRKVINIYTWIMLIRLKSASAIFNPCAQSPNCFLKASIHMMSIYVWLWWAYDWCVYIHTYTSRYI